MITIISGLPCSGKTLMLRMLEAGNMPVLEENDAADQTPSPWTASGPRSGSQAAINPHWLAAAEGKACRIAPSLLFNLPASHEYRIIFMSRPLDAILASFRDTLPGPEDRKPPPEVVRYHWERLLRRVRRLVEGPRQLAAHICDYDEMLASPLLVSRQVAGFVGLRLNTRAMADVIQAHAPGHGEPGSTSFTRRPPADRNP